MRKPLWQQAWRLVKLSLWDACLQRPVLLCSRSVQQRACWVCVLLGMCPAAYVSCCVCVLLGMCPAAYVSCWVCVLLRMCPAAYVSCCVCVLLRMCPVGYVSCWTCHPPEVFEGHLHRLLPHLLGVVCGLGEQHCILLRLDVEAVSAHRGQCGGEVVCVCGGGEGGEGRRVRHGRATVCKLVQTSCRLEM
jgi:hypothetical protein